MLQHHHVFYDKQFRKNSYGYRLTVGKIFTPENFTGSFRTEIEFGYVTNSAKSGTSTVIPPVLSSVSVNYKTSAKAYSGMLNIYYDIDLGSKFIPYAGFGIGYARTNSASIIESNRYDERKDNFAWNIGAGLSYKITTSIKLDLAYRYSDYGKHKSNISETLTVSPVGTVNANEMMKNDYTFHEIMFGVRYNF